MTYIIESLNTTDSQLCGFPNEHIVTKNAHVALANAFLGIELRNISRWREFQA